MQSCRVSVMSVKSSIKTSDNSEGQRQNTVWFISWTRKTLLRSSRCLSLYEFIFSSQKKFCKKGNCGDPVLHKHEGEVWHVAPEKWAWPGVDIFFFFARCEEFSIFFSTLVFGVLHVWHEGELGNLVRQINERHMCVELFFFHARNHSLSSLFSSTK